MNHIVHALLDYQITPWKAVGYVGTALFAGRWIVQLYFTRKHRRVVMPLLFWILSVCGSTLLLAYFIFGKNDSVGIFANLFPAFVSVYNLVMHVRHQKNGMAGGATA
jgi:lipid-A-disaccharide synthase-like uncharacterized protein